MDRYHLDWMEGGVNKDPNGEYVLFEDAENLEAENKRLREALDDLIYQARRVCHDCRESLDLVQAETALERSE